jgi:excisionase family DNA binding protein
MRLQEAADLLGVHYQTAYGWVRSGKLPARLVTGGYEVTDADVQEFLAKRRLGRKPATAIQVRDWDSQATRLYQAIVTGQETAARRAMERLAGHVTMTDVCERLIAPALRRIGDQWHAGLVSVAQEHRATAICERLIAANAAQPSGRPRGTAVVTTPAGERHGMPALMAAACLRENHWQVHHLACDLPSAEIATLAREVAADLVVLSTAAESSAAEAGTAATLVRATVPGAVVLIGRTGDSLADLVTRAKRLRPKQPAGAAVPAEALDPWDPS